MYTRMQRCDTVTVVHPACETIAAPFVLLTNTKDLTSCSAHIVCLHLPHLESNLNTIKAFWLCLLTLRGRGNDKWV